LESAKLWNFEIFADKSTVVRQFYPEHRAIEMGNDVTASEMAGALVAFVVGGKSPSLSQSAFAPKMSAVPRV
jgi:hypothetical protein